MKVSLYHVKQFIDVDLPPVDELIDRINRQLGSVEEVVNIGEKYQGAVIVKVSQCDKHPNADRLSVTKVDDGGAIEGVERDSDGLVQVVCGADNVHAGMFAVWLPPGATVPESFNSNDPFVLFPKELRGIVSNGMLASAKELQLGDDHSGIVEINQHDLRHDWAVINLDHLVGKSFAEVFGLDDVVVDIENKMFTHRPDLFGQIGIAREISAIIQGVTDQGDDVIDTRFKNPDWYWSAPQLKSANGLTLKVFNDAVDRVPRLMFVAMDNVKVGPSPLWLRCELVAMGSKSINNLVDITNYVMLITAQPTHAYDFDKLSGGKIGSRMAREGETVKLLNGKSYNLTSDDIVIADGEKPIALGGIMGGFDSEVTYETKRVVLEVATFDMYTARKSSMRHGLATDALTRFNKGQSPLQNSRVMARLIKMTEDIAGAEQASDVFDEPNVSGRFDETTLSGSIEVSTGFINSRLGSELMSDQIGNLLRRVNFALLPKDEANQNLVTYTAPFWRTDIEQPEDIVEEVGRLYDFSRLPRKLPKRTIFPTPDNQSSKLKSDIRQRLTRLGANELLNYSFVSRGLIEKVKQDPNLAFQVVNAISPDLEYYRLSLLPSLLEKIHANIKSGFDRFAMFEFGKAHIIGDMADDGLPRESNRLALVFTADDKLSKNYHNASFYQAKYYINQMSVKMFPTAVSYTPLADVGDIQDADFKQMTAPFDINRSAVVKVDDGVVGVVGEFQNEVTKALKLPKYTAGFEVLVPRSLPQGNEVYRALSRFPRVTQDVSLRVKTNVLYKDVSGLVESELDRILPENTSYNLQPISIYQADDNEDYKTITLHLEFTSYQKTMRDKEIVAIIGEVAEVANRQIGAERV